MMGQQPRTESLFYYFRLQDQIPSLTSDYAVIHKEWTSGQRISRELLVGFAESPADRIVLICSTKTVSS
jgi:hypothetical protein